MRFEILLRYKSKQNDNFFGEKGHHKEKNLLLDVTLDHFTMEKLDLMEEMIDDIPYIQRI